MVRTVPGRTDRVVVVGAGLAGLSAALRLRGAGREVTVVERGPGPGGRAGRIEERGYALDTGPSVFTAPELIADTLAAVGERLEDRLTLTPLDTTYRAQFADGSHLDVHADPDAFAAEVAALCGSGEAAALRRYLADLAELYRLQLDTFIDRNLDTPLDLLGPELVALARRGGFGRLSRHVARAFTDDRLRRLFSFQALYAGVSPQRAIAAYAVIAQLDIGAGVWHPAGGIVAVPRALAAAAADAGVVLRYGCGVRELELTGARATGVLLDDGERVPADALVVTVDQPERLVPGFARRRRPVYSPSCVALHVGVRAELPGQAHHTISFGTAWEEVFDELTRFGRPMTDPSLLVSMPSRTDRSLAPDGGQVLSIVAPTPNLDRRSGGNPDLDWPALGPRYRDEVLATLETRGWTGLTGAIEVEHMDTPLTWAAQGMAAGTPFALAHTFGQTGPFRTPTLPRRGPENVVLAGSSVQPGVGVPMVVISGRLAAERITGPEHIRGSARGTSAEVPAREAR
ncbi:phytoene desaturase family protein [Geodermatophilus sabuli]|uniref:Phytoene desaturase n=1 Tax=Geodermatophilus sabuli TaxID=1564158 RepID=A0A285E7D6_9ACTN|nr:phytoene desaturase family protein [Geodermatophilus sabuli]MBB3082116.1 phytoene desaturase [Geodermatophilus sabuli]SNX95012.1 phytoene desaturase [Geodermatophilus sabuli]